MYNALAIPRAGEPVRLVQRDLPPLNEGELVVRVDYASINKMDPALAQRNLFQLPEPYVLGFDFSGEVVDAGGTAFQVGDQVFGRADRGGSFAEMIVARAERVMLRGAIPAAEASGYGIAYLTAYESMVPTAHVENHAGKWIFIAGAGGGVGHFAAQIAKLYGLQVIGSAGKPASIELLRNLGLDAVIDYAKQDVVAEVMRTTGGKGADLVYDSTYTQSSYDTSAQTVAAGGTYIRLGSELQMQRFGVTDVSQVVEARGAKLVIADLGRFQTDPAYVARIAEVIEGQRRAVTWFEQGTLRPVITSVVPFEATALQTAFDQFLEGVTNVGKVVVKVR